MFINMHHICTFLLSSLLLLLLFWCIFLTYNYFIDPRRVIVCLTAAPDISVQSSAQWGVCVYLSIVTGPRAARPAGLWPAEWWRLLCCRDRHHALQQADDDDPYGEPQSSGLPVQRWRTQIRADTAANATLTLSAHHIRATSEAKRGFDL